jgi:hypothetical protein
MILYGSVLIIEGNVSDKLFTVNQNTHSMFNIFFLNNVAYEITWKNLVDPDRPQVAIQ